jgi:hypothetical protein
MVFPADTSNMAWIKNVHDDGFSSNTSCELHYRYLRFYYHHGVDTSVACLLVTEGIKFIKISETPTKLDAHFWYLRFYYYHWVYTSAGGLLVRDGSIYPVVSASVLTLFILYIFIEIYSSKIM